MKSVFIAFCCLTLCAVPASAKSKAKATASMSDQQFVAFAAQTDMVEANIGQLAEAAADATPIKDDAKLVVANRTSDYHRLFDAAHESSLTVPTAIDEEMNKKVVGPFHGLKGPAFDRRYAREMSTRDAIAIEVFQRESVASKDGALKSYAAQSLIVFRKRIADAKNLEKLKISSPTA
jgi:putative membrane protein